MRLEGHPFLGDLAQLGQTEHLKSAAVGQDRTVPTGHLVQPAQLGHNLIAGAQMQMIGVAEHNLAADILQIQCGKPALDGCCGGHIHKCRGLYRTMYGFKLPAACIVLLFE